MEDIDIASVRNEAQAAFKAKDYSAAMALLQKIEHIGDSEVKQKLGVCYRKTRQFERAIIAFKDSLRIHEDVKTYIEYARALFMHGQIDEAITIWKTSLTLKETWHAYHQLGNAYIKKRNYIDAVVMMRAALGIAKNWQSHQFIGIALLKLKHYKLAEEEFYSSLSLKPNFNTYFLLGELYRKIGNLEEALKQYNTSFEMRPQASIQQKIGVIYSQKGEVLKSIQALERSISLQVNPDTYHLLSRMHAKNNDFRKAISTLIHSYQINPDPFLEQEYISLVQKDKNELIATAYRICFSDVKKDQKKLNSNWQAIIEETMKRRKIDPLFLHMKSSVLEQNILDEPAYNQTYPISFLRQKLHKESPTHKIRKQKMLFGVSHARLYYSSELVVVKECGPGTMDSINNPNSQIGHYKYILKEIESLRPNSHDLIFEFGEIDLRAHILKASRKLNLSPRQVINNSVENYFQFITQIAERGYTIYISGPHCGGGKGMNTAIPIDNSERNDLCRYMNLQLLKKCQMHSFHFYTMFDVAVDMASMRERSNFFYDQIHLHLPPNPYGNLLRQIAEQKILNATQDIAYYESYLAEKNVVAPIKILYSNLKEVTSNSILKPGELSNPISIDVDQKYYILLQLPYPLEFEMSLIVSGQISSIDCFAIYEPFDPSYMENAPNLIKCNQYTNDYKNKFKIKFSMSGHQCINQKCNYVLMSMISKSKSSILSINLRSNAQYDNTN